MPFSPNECSDADDAIRGTNDDATVSRLSAVQCGYLDDPFVQHFVRRPTRRAPIINRGTYLRSLALHRLVRQFLALPGPKKQIVSLGAGYDTRYFMIKSGLLGEGSANALAQYFEVDFAELAATKAMIIKRRRELADLLSKDASSDMTNKERLSSDYCIIAGDLRQWDHVVERLLYHGLDPTAPTLFLSECVFIYLSPEHANTILRWIKERMKSCMFALYEQILPNDAFGQTMIRNLRSRGIDLKGIHACPDLEQQQTRFTDLGWQCGEAVDLNTVDEHCLDQADRARIAKQEMLDEWEEWRLLSSHYCVAWAYHTKESTSPFNAIHLLDMRNKAKE